MENENSNVGYVYVVEMEGQGIFKIGKTVDVSRRMGQFGIQPPFPYKLLFAHKVWNMHFCERCLHELYDPCRLNGEWFRLSLQQVKTIHMHLLAWQAEGLVNKIGDIIAEVAHDATDEYLLQACRLLIASRHRTARRIYAHTRMDTDHLLYGVPFEDVNNIPRLAFSTESEAVS